MLYKLMKRNSDKTNYESVFNTELPSLFLKFSQIEKTREIKSALRAGKFIRYSVDILVFMFIRRLGDILRIARQTSITRQ